MTTTDLTWTATRVRSCPAGGQGEEGQALVEIAEGREDPVELPGGQALHQSDDILQGEGDADGRDEGHELRRVAQGPVCRPLHEHGHAARGGHGDDQGHGEIDIGAQRARGLEHPEPVHRDEELHADESADREDLRMGEVDELEDSIDHRVAQGDRRIDEAEGHPVDEDLGQVVDGVGDDVDALRVQEELVRSRAPAEEGQDDHQRGEERSRAGHEDRHPPQGQEYLPQGPRARASHGASKEKPPPPTRGRGFRTCILTAEGRLGTFGGTAPRPCETTAGERSPGSCRSCSTTTCPDPAR